MDEDDLKLIEQMRLNGGDMLTIAMRQFAEEYPVAANVGFVVSLFRFCLLFSLD